MTLHYNGRSIHVESTNPYKFISRHGHTIEVTPDKYGYNVLCTASDGGIILRGAMYETIEEAAQDCIDRLGGTW